MDLKADLKLPVTLQAQDKFGNQTGSFDSPPNISLSDPSFGALEVAADGLSALFTPAGKLGALQLLASAQSGGKPLSGSLDLNILAGDAVQLAIVPGTPVPA